MHANEEFKLNRKNFLKTLGLLGIGSLFNASVGKSEPGGSFDLSNNKKTVKHPPVPRRKLGKTGVLVPCLSIGLIEYSSENQVVLKNALKWGVNFWDTAGSYNGGLSESGIGEFIKKRKGIRKDLFIVTKSSGSESAEILENKLQISLKRMNTDHIDLFFGVHGMFDPVDLTGEMRQWVKSAKQRKLIRYFGFSTHSNMADCLIAASKVDYIDAIMTSYNFRLMQDNKMQEAVETCYRAGIGLIAMKVLGHTSIRTDADRKLTDHFIKSGYTKEQAKIKAVLSDKRISSACIGMKSVASLTTNVSAVLDKKELSQTDMDILNQHAGDTCSSYCAGCSSICNAAMPEAPYISHIMRCLMYYNSYADRDKARELFSQIPGNLRNRLSNLDYRKVEARCPQHIPIGKFVSEAVRKMA